MKPLSFLILAFLMLAVALLGCGGGEVLGPVSGVITIEGQPVPRATVIFDNDQLGVHMSAPTDEQGRYTVQMAKGKGLPLGEYEVRVCPPVQDHPLGPIKAPPPGDHNDLYLNTIPKRYRKRETSDLRLKVTADGIKLDVDMKRN